MRSILDKFGAVRNIANFPLYRDRRMSAVIRYLRWQVARRVMPYSLDFNWAFVNDSVLRVRNKNYNTVACFATGLHEFEDMAFLLHFLRPEDLFADVGANAGVFTVLAGKAIGSRCVTFEPVPTTFEDLECNVFLNQMTDRVRNHNVGVGNETGTLRFTSELGGYNHVVPDGETDESAVEVPVRTLDDLLEGAIPTLIKMDVEGFEQQVCEGAEQTMRHPECRAMIVEIANMKVYSGSRYGNTREKLYETISSYGFKPYTYEPFERVLVPEAESNVKHSHRNTIFLKDVDKAAARLKDAPTFTVNEVTL